MDRTQDLLYAASLAAGPIKYIGAYNKNDNLFAGDIAEILAYNVTISDDDRQRIETHLSEKYNIFPNL